MDAAAVVAGIRTVQGALQVLSTLQLTAYLWPPQAHVFDGASYDYIVVGAGSAGSVVASRLSEDPALRVLLVEAGGDPPIESVLPGLLAYVPETREDWNYTSVANRNTCVKNHSIHLTRGKMLGGSSSANYMFYVRGNPHDYDLWASAANDPSWEYRNILPYFKKSEDLRDNEVLDSPYGAFHGTEGYLGVTKEIHKEAEDYLDAFAEVGNKVVLDVNGPDTLGYTQPMYTIADGVRQSSAYAFLRPARRRPNLDVLKDTLVTKVLFDDHNNAIGVEALAEDDRKITLKADKEVILSAGAFNSPQLLMLSGLGPKEHLESLHIDVRADLPVGQNLQDHVGTLISIKMKNLHSPPAPPPDPTKFPGVFFPGFVALDKCQTYPDYESENFVFPPNSTGFLQFCAFTFGIQNEICQKIYDAGIGSETLFSVLNILSPKSRGEVKLRSTDPRELPLVELETFSKEEDLEHLAQYVEHYLDVVNATWMRREGAEPVQVELEQCPGLRPGSREYWRCYIRCINVPQYHFCGTCALGTVVDARLRVRNVQRLRVADASVIPHITSCNINAPVIMIAEKAADMIKEDLSTY